jgi:hypothetical protein
MHIAISINVLGGVGKNHCNLAFGHFFLLHFSRLRDKHVLFCDAGGALEQVTSYMVQLLKATCMLKKTSVKFLIPERNI